MQTSYPNKDKQLFIRFPTVTKLIYPFENPHEGQPLRTSYRSNSNIREHIKFTLLSKTEDFKIVQLPPKHQIMNICRMTMREKVDRPEEQPLQKQIFSVKKAKSTNPSPEKVRSSSLKNLNKLRTLPPLTFDFTQIYPYIAQLFALSFGVKIELDSLPRTRKAKVQEGNNGYLVRQIIKKRGWWTIISEDSKFKQSLQPNLIWTQYSFASKQQQRLTQNNLYCLKETTQKYEDQNLSFPKHFERILSQLQKVKRLFFTQWQKEGRIKDQIFKMSQKCTMILRIDNLTVNNHLPMHRELTDKKMLFRNMVRYYQQKGENPYERVPKSYHLTCFDWQESVQEVLKTEGEWILKPGENTNQGKGITIFRSSKEAANYILVNPPTKENRSLLLQTYIRPSLYNQRKYDLRCFLLAFQINHNIRFFWYQQGYVRTSSRKFSMKATSKGIHLTNDSVQKNLKHYGQHQPSNKLSFQELDKYMLNNETFSLFKDILPKVKVIARELCEAVGDKMREKSEIAFELFGLDFLIDQEGKPWLLEVNTNPSLQTNCNLLTRIIPQVLQNTMRLLDIFLGVKRPYEYAQHFLLNNKFSLLHAQT